MKKNTFINHIVMNFIPFIVMTLVAVFYLFNSYILLEQKNVSLVEGQIRNIIEKIEIELLSVRRLADEMISDTALSKKSLDDYRESTIAGIDKMQHYESQIPYHAYLYISYWNERLVIGEGTSKVDTFVNTTLKLDQESKEKFYKCYESEEKFDSVILKQQNGAGYLMFQIYVPEKYHVDEERIGIILETKAIADEVSKCFQDIDGIALLYWEDQAFERIACLPNALSEEQLDEYYYMMENGEEIDGYTMITCRAENFDFEISLGIDNRNLRRGLIVEEIKMIAIGFFVFVVLAVFLWIYTHYRYVMMERIKKFISVNHPELDAIKKENEYNIIHKVLEKDLETLTRKEEEFYRFKEDAKKQLAWFLINSPLPEELPIEEFMTGYGMEWEDSFGCVIDFLIDREEDIEEEEIRLDQSEIVFHCDKKMDGKIIVMVCINLKGRDSDYKERLRLIHSISGQLQQQGYRNVRVGCGLVYDSLSDMHNSQQEAFALLQDENQQAEGEIFFFSEQVNMVKRVPYITADLLRELKQYIREKRVKEALSVFDMLMAAPEDMAGDLLLYNRYKVISIITEEAIDMEVNDMQIRRIVSLCNLEGQEFISCVHEVINSLFASDVKEEKVELEEIVSYIEEHYGDVNLSVEMIASHFRINERSVRRIMKRGINKTYKEYLNEIRLKHACDLLIRTDMTIQNISSQTGFYHVNTFYRVFRQVSGMSPDEYRKRNK